MQIPERSITESDTLLQRPTFLRHATGGSGRRRTIPRVDAALETYRKGAAVTMVIRGNEIGKRVKYWVKPDIENRIKEGSIQAFFNSCINEPSANRKWIFKRPMALLPSRMIM